MLFDSLWTFGNWSSHKRTRRNKKQQRLRQLLFSRLGFERLEDRALLSVTSDSLALSWATPLSGQTFTMNAEIIGTVLAGTSRTGTLTLSEGGTTLASVNLATAQPNNSNWYALSVPSGLPLGSNVLNIAYSGDTNYAPTSSTVTIEVNNDSLALSYSTSVVAGLPYTVNAAINGALLNNTPRTGTLSLLDGATTLATVNVATARPTSSGYYALSVPGGLTVGTHSLKVTYTGDSNYSALTSTLATVTAANDLVTASYGTPALVGQSYTMSAAIQGILLNNTPRTGMLSLLEGSTTLASVDVATATPNSSGYYTLTVPGGLSAGTNSLKVVYSGDANYAAASTSFSVTGVGMLGTSIGPVYSTSVNMDQPFTVSAAILGTLAPNLPRTGTLSLLEGTNTLASINVATTLLPTGSAYYALTVPGGLSAGIHNLTVTYSGDPDYATSTATLLPITAHAVSTSIGYSFSTPLVNQPFTLNASVNGTLLTSTPRTGTLTLSDNGSVLASVNLATSTPTSLGYYALSVPAGLPVGSNALTVAYSGDANYAASTISTTVAVNNDSFSLGYSTSVLAAASYSVSVAINGTLVNNAPRTGTLSLVEGNSTLASINLTATPSASGYYQYTLTVPGGLAAGTHSLKVLYSGDANYSALTSNLATITAANDLLVLSYAGQSLVGQTYSVNAAIQTSPGINTPPTGTLSLVEGTTTLSSVTVGTTTPNSSGYYTLAVPGGLTLGVNSLKVVYSGDSNYTAVTTSLSPSGVTMVSTSLGLSYATSLNLGQSLTVSAIINGTLEPGLPRTGTLSLLQGTTTLASINLATATPASNGYYALTLPTALPLGTYNLTAAYSGDTNYAASTANLVPITVHAPSTSISLSWATPLMNQPFTMNAAINPTAQAGMPHTGTLTLSDNGSALVSINLASATPSSSGYYALSVPAGLQAGSNVLTVGYSGDANYGASTATVTLTLTNDSFSWSYGTSVLVGVNYTVSVAINGALVNNTPRTGTLSLFEGTTTLASVNVATTTPASNGYYALTVPGGLPAGSYSNLKVTYSGDSLYSALSSAMGTVTVSNDVLALAYASSQTLVGQPFWLNVAVQTTPGSTPSPTGTLTLTEGTTTLATLNVATSTPNSTGYYTLNVPAGLALGTNSLKVAYSGDTIYAPATSAYLTITGVTTVSTSVGLSYSTPLTGQAFTMNAVINPTAMTGVPHTGTLTLSDNGSILASLNLASATPSTSGYYALTVPAGLPLGNNVLIVSYSGDSNYGASSTTATLAVNNDSFSWSYPTSVLVGVNYTVTVAINGALVNNTPRTGTLSLLEGTTTLASVNLATATPASNGYYALTVSGGLPIGTYSNLKITYSGDALYTALSAAMGTVTVSNDLLAFSYASSQTLVGQPFWLNVAIQTSPGSTPAPTGMLTLTEGTTTLATVNLANSTPNSTGYYTLNVPGGLALGTNSLKVAYSGDTNYAAATSAFLTITGVTTVSTSVGLSYSTPLTGQAFTMNAVINPTAQAGVPHTGTLTLSDNGSALASVNLAAATPSSSGYYALSVPAGLPAGSNVLTVAYSGDANYGASTATATLAVNNDSLSLSYGTLQLAGSNYTVSAAINGALVNNALRTGTLSLIEGSTTLVSVNVATAMPNSSGQYALTVPGGLPIGTYSNLKVTYSGDTNYSALSSTMATVTIANDLVALVNYTGQTLIGEPYSLGAEILTSPGSTATPTGTLTLTEGTTTLATLSLATSTPSSLGVYTLSIPGGLPAGNNVLKVLYGGDANYAAASSQITVTGVTTVSTYIGLSWATPLAGQAFTMNAVINPTAQAGVPHTGTLTLSDNGTALASINLATSTPSSTGYYALTVPTGLPIGSNALAVAYSGDANYAASSGTATVTVAGNDSFSWSYSTSALVGVNYTVSVGINGALVNNTPRTGTLLLLEGTTALASVNVTTTLPGSNGLYALTVPGGLPAGSYSNLKVTYSGDVNYSALSSALGTVTVSNDVLALSYASSQSLVGQPFALNVAVQTAPGNTSTPTGTLTLTEGAATLATINLATSTPNSSGYYTLNVPAGLALGANSLKVAYSGDTIYAAAMSSILTITGVTTLSTSVGLSYATPLAGLSFTMSAAVNPTALAGVPHTGTLTLSDNGSALVSINLATSTPSSSGYYALTVPAGLPLGSNVLTVSYSGDANYGASTGTTTLLVNNDSFSWSYGTSVLVGVDYTVSVAINGALVNNTPRTGTLSLIEGTTTLASVNVGTTSPGSNGYYALTVPGGLPAGSYSNLKVTYSGDSLYSPLSSAMSTVNVSNDVLALSYASSQTLVGQPFWLNVAVQTAPGSTPLPTGTLTLTEGTTTLATLSLASSTPNSSGYYTLNVPAGLTLGTNSLKVTYSGDTIYAAATSAFLTITGVRLYTTYLGVGYSLSPIVGQSYTVSTSLSGTVISGTPRTGTISLMEGTTTLVSVNIATTSPVNGDWGLTMPTGLPLGSHNLTVVYSGDANYTSASSTMSTIIVRAAGTTIGWNYSGTPLVDQPFTLNAAINGTLLTNTPRTGTLTLSDNGSPLLSINLAASTPNSSGYYALSVPAGLPAGSNILTVFYSGDVNYGSSSATIPLTINNDSLSLSFSTLATVGQPFTVNVGIVTIAGVTAIPTGTLTLMEGTTALVTLDLSQATPDSFGRYALTVPGGLAAGANSLKVLYSGDVNFNALTVSLATVTAS